MNRVPPNTAPVPAPTTAIRPLPEDAAEDARMRMFVTPGRATSTLSAICPVSSSAIKRLESSPAKISRRLDHLGTGWSGPKTGYFRSLKCSVRSFSGDCASDETPENKAIATTTTTPETLLIPGLQGLDG